jgi:sulfofructose kinase
MNTHVSPALFVGGFIIDVTNKVPRWPTSNEKLTAKKQVLCAGGGATNSSRCYHQLGLPCELLVPVPVDGFADGFVNQLSKSGIHVHRRDVAETFVSVVTPEGEDRSLIRGPEYEYLSENQGLDLDASKFSRLHLDGKEPDAALYYAKAFRRIGRHVSLDVNPGRDNTDELLGFVDIAFASEKYFKEQGGTEAELFDYFRHKGCKAGGITYGPKGVVWFAEGIERKETRAFYVPPGDVVDSSGAGDGFQGSLLASHDLFGSQRTWEQHIRFACAVAAMMVQQFGNKLFPTVEQVAAFQQPHLVRTA